MAKMTRERTVKERRARKQEKKEEKRQAAAAERSENADESTVAGESVDDTAAEHERLKPR